MSLHAGFTAEALVISDLAKHGIPSFSTPQLMPYDLVADFGGKLLKVQVKANVSVKMPGGNNRTAGWRFRLVNGGTKTAYKPGEVDVFALVALATGEIGYLLASETSEISLSFMPSGFSRRFTNSKQLTDFPLTKIISKLKGVAA